ncbi:ABC transporter ATP-binding protein [Acuticoccus sp. MNP-M23]|uniref:ABC transporter ATP-binding protein n=1 Tax=Acuticoccus sp. MNP-M23 TaxID=3072793 RepID=UPI0028149B12|nr:ABC transporter ATP-binding protein [Acuticoccus sp. MNP-M23]WMS44590.1 ABC transporter ATP-binding protein [Acuticoccus sp. MNP-M23]
MLLEIRNLNRAFGAVTVADDISLDVAEGEALGIIGPNGAGKSTLFNLITGRVAPQGGSIRLDGAEISRLPARRRVNLGIGRSFQIPQPFEQMTTYENVSVAACFGAGGSERAEQGSVVEVLHRTDLLAKANLPAGSLSLLERKRLEMARALATRPRLLLLDEIAGGLTDAECTSLIETIRQINADGTTIVWIEHVTHALLAVVSRLVALDFGKIIGEGDPEAVMASDAVRRIYLGMEV